MENHFISNGSRISSVLYIYIYIKLNLLKEKKNVYKMYTRDSINHGVDCRVQLSMKSRRGEKD